MNASPHPYPLRFVIDGQAMSKKRNWTIVRTRGRGGTPRIVLTRQYREWEKGAVDQLWVQRVGYQASMLVPWEPVAESVAVELLFFMKDKKRYDLSNLIQGAEDALVKAGILKDDSLIESYDGTRKYLSVDNPRVEITIRPFYGG